MVIKMRMRITYTPIRKKSLKLNSGMFIEGYKKGDPSTVLIEASNYVTWYNNTGCPNIVSIIVDRDFRISQDSALLLCESEIAKYDKTVFGKFENKVKAWFKS